MTKAFVMCTHDTLPQQDNPPDPNNPLPTNPPCIHTATWPMRVRVRAAIRWAVPSLMAIASLMSLSNGICLSNAPLL